LFGNPANALRISPSLRSPERVGHCAADRALTIVGFPVIRQVLLGIPEDFEYRPAVFA
jgi:hypothetical protein